MLRRMYVSCRWNSGAKEMIQRLDYVIGFDRPVIQHLFGRDQLETKKFWYVLQQDPGGRVSIYGSLSKEEAEAILQSLRRRGLTAIRKGNFTAQNFSSTVDKLREGKHLKIARGENASVASIAIRAYNYPWFNQTDFKKINLVEADLCMDMPGVVSFKIPEEHNLNRQRRHSITKENGMTRYKDLGETPVPVEPQRYDYDALRALAVECGFTVRDNFLGFTVEKNLEV